MIVVIISMYTNYSCLMLLHACLHLSVVVVVGCVTFKLQLGSNDQIKKKDSN